MAQVVAETQGDKRPVPAAGVYRHRETGVEMIALQTAKFGNPQGDAYTKMGFEYVGPVEKKADVKAVENIPDPHAAPITSPQGTKSAAELRVELAAAEAREQEFAEARGEDTDKVKKAQAEEAAAAEKAEQEAAAAAEKAAKKAEADAKKAEKAAADAEKGDK